MSPSPTVNVAALAPESVHLLGWAVLGFNNRQTHFTTENQGTWINVRIHKEVKKREEEDEVY